MKEASWTLILTSAFSKISLGCCYNHWCDSLLQPAGTVYRGLYRTRHLVWTILCHHWWFGIRCGKKAFKMQNHSTDGFFHLISRNVVPTSVPWCYRNCYECWILAWSNACGIVLYQRHLCTGSWNHLHCDQWLHLPGSLLPLWSRLNSRATTSHPNDQLGPDQSHLHNPNIS